MSQEKSKKESLNNSQNEPKEILIGDYIIKKTIGTGTFSTVKLGVHRITQKKVAVKILDKNKIESKDDLERIIREMQILTEMDHQNVIKIFKIYEEEDNFSIIMEYCEGGELFNYIVKKQRLSEDETCFFFYQIINGIEYIHSKGIAHRDLKPENLLIGKNQILKIIDFGLSNFYDGQKRLETPCGSPCYASPEMVKGKKYDGFNIDIWAIGVILFAMLCGYLPFEDDENDNDILFSQIIKNKIDYPSFLSELSLDMLKKILVSDPLKRITVDEIKKHEFYLKGEKIYNEKFKKVEEVNNKEKNIGILDKIAKAFKSEDDSDKNIIPITLNEKKAEKKIEKAKNIINEIMDNYDKNKDEQINNNDNSNNNNNKKNIDEKHSDDNNKDNNEKKDIENNVKKNKVENNYIDKKNVENAENIEKNNIDKNSAEKNKEDKSQNILFLDYLKSDKANKKNNIQHKAPVSTINKEENNNETHKEINNLNYTINNEINKTNTTKSTNINNLTTNTNSTSNEHRSNNKSISPNEKINENIYNKINNNMHNKANIIRNIIANKNRSNDIGNRTKNIINFNYNDINSIINNKININKYNKANNIDNKNINFLINGNTTGKEGLVNSFGSSKKKKIFTKLQIKNHKQYRIGIQNIISDTNTNKILRNKPFNLNLDIIKNSRNSFEKQNPKFNDELINLEKTVLKTKHNINPNNLKIIDSKSKEKETSLKKKLLKYNIMELKHYNRLINQINININNNISKSVQKNMMTNYTKPMLTNNNIINLNLILNNSLNSNKNLDSLQMISTSNAMKKNFPTTPSQLRYIPTKKSTLPSITISERIKAKINPNKYHSINNKYLSTETNYDKIEKQKKIFLNNAFKKHEYMRLNYPKNHRINTNINNY